MRSVLTAILCVTLIALPARAQQWQRPMHLLESDGSPVVVDGLFDSYEWQDALLIPDTETCDVHLKRNDGYLYVGVQCADLELPVLDLFLSPGGEDIYQLHVSSYLAERVLEEDETAESFWRSGLNLDWTANEVKWNTIVSDSLGAIGVYGQDMLRQAVAPFEGFEVRIGEKQFSSAAWQMRVQVSQFASDLPPVIIPTSNGVVNSWVLLDFASPGILSGPVRLR